MREDERGPVDHRAMAVETFNLTWDYLGRDTRTSEENDMMVHTAHASRYHWGLVGTPVELERGDWQLSRVYATIGKGAEALHYAKHCLNTCMENEISGFDLAFAYEAMARAHAVNGNWRESDMYLQNAKQAAKGIEKDEDQRYLVSQLDSVPRMP